ncbi:MAG: hypothetical protein AB200_02490 [Parcubacteria bacterium C7867-005]|nr:MAG: hypothetical protein AB200_02490 [Parcubacteria bacterium C7867-005]
MKKQLTLILSVFILSLFVLPSSASAQTYPYNPSPNCSITSFGVSPTSMTAENTATVSWTGAYCGEIYVSSDAGEQYGPYTDVNRSISVSGYPNTVTYEISGVIEECSYEEFGTCMSYSTNTYNLGSRSININGEAPTADVADVTGCLVSFSASPSVTSSNSTTLNWTSSCGTLYLNDGVSSVAVPSSGSASRTLHKGVNAFSLSATTWFGAICGGWPGDTGGCQSIGMSNAVGTLSVFNVNPVPATVTVNSCAAGGSFSITGPGGYVNYGPYYFYGTDTNTASPASVYPSAGGSTYTISYTPPSGYTASISPASGQVMYPNGTYSFTATCTPTGPVPEVTISASPTSGSVNSVNPQISWSVTNTPTSCTASGDWSGTKAASGTNESQGVLTSVRQYTYTLTCINANGQDSESAYVDVTVTPPAFNYSLGNSGTSSVTKGGVDVYTQNTITKTLTAGASQSVDLSLSNVPSGVSYSFANQTCSPTCSTAINFTISPSATAGDHTINVTGSPLSKTTSFTLRIIASPAIIVSCTATPSGARIGDTVTWNATVSGGVPPYTYRWTGTNVPTTPAPLTQSFNIVYSTVGQKNAMLTVTDSLSNSGSCSSPQGQIQINFNPIFEEF